MAQSANSYELQTRLHNVYSSRYNALDVSIQDHTTPIVDLHMTQRLGSITLVADTAIDDKTITLEPGHGVVVGNTICLREDIYFYQGNALAVDTNTITLDSPLDYGFTTSADGFRGNETLAVDGSVTPVIFRISPPTDTKWDITRLIFTMRSTTSMDDGKFGGITALTNGIVIRAKDGITKNIFNAKTNGDFASHTYDVTYIPDTLGPGGQYGFRCRRSFNGFDKNGVVIRLDGATLDEFQVIVQDDLTGLSYFSAVAQGHVVQD